ncbi:MAG TPA: peptidoglycan DD-metalloendopeptidase family protein [Candidatus Obscuribacterales bacterium]
MTEQKKYPTSDTRQGRWCLGLGSYTLLGLGCLTGLVLFSGRVIATDEFSIPVEAEPVEAFVPSVPEATTGYSDNFIEPEFTYSEPEPLGSDYYTAPEPSYSEPAYTPEPEYYSEPYSEPYTPEIPNIVPAPEQEIVFPEFPPEAESPANAYIDPTDYQIGATEGYTDGYEPPSTVVFSERSTGCEAALALGQAAGDLCSPAYSAPIYQAENNQVPYTGNTPYIGNNNLGSIPNPLLDGGNTAYTQPNSSYSNGFVANSPAYTGGGYEANYTYTEQPQAVDYGYSSSYSGEVAVAGFSPVKVGPMVVSSMSNSGLVYYNRTQRPTSVRGNGDTSVLFPLTIPSPITSLFGWRQHPVLGYGRFHTGIDLGADEGTPVVASYSGQVSVADWLGGYGITVVLNHSEKSQETLYGHLSELFVKPGEQVKQGDVIGRVGSTGVSTGPHLHFELRKLTSQGWVAIDPRNDIEVGLAQLLNTMKVAQVPSSEFIAKLTEDVETGMPKLPPLPPGVDVIIPNLEPPTLNFGFVENLKSPS